MLRHQGTTLQLRASTPCCHRLALPAASFAALLLLGLSSSLKKSAREFFQPAAEASCSARRASPGIVGKACRPQVKLARLTFHAEACWDAAGKYGAEGAREVLPLRKRMQNCSRESRIIHSKAKHLPAEVPRQP